MVKRYLQFNGKLSNLVLVAGLFLLTQFACSGADAFVAYWIRVERNNYDGNTSISEIAMNNKEEQSDLRIRFVLISSSLVVLILFLGILRTLVFHSSTTRISKAIHREMLNGVLNTRLRFFEVNPSGRVLNKFSRDLGAMDVQLPKVLLDALQMLLIICGATSVVLIVSPIFIVPLLLLSLLFRAVRQLSSIHLKRLEGISKKCKTDSRYSNPG